MQVSHRNNLCQYITVLKKTSIMTGQFPPLLNPIFYYFCPIEIKSMPGLNNCHFQCALWNIRSHCKHKFDTKFGFQEPICTRILIELFSCTSGTATYIAGYCRALLHMDEADEAEMSQPLGTQVFPCQKS